MRHFQGPLRALKSVSSYDTALQHPSLRRASYFFIPMKKAQDKPQCGAHRIPHSAARGKIEIGQNPLQVDMLHHFHGKLNCKFLQYLN